MKKESIFTFALLLFVVLACSNGNTTQPNNGSPASNTGGGPVSNSSGPSREDWGPNRDPEENAHDWRLRQQGQVGPCSSAFQEMHTAYFEWKNGRLAHDRYLEIQRRYDECVAREYGN